VVFIPSIGCGIPFQSTNTAWAMWVTDGIAVYMHMCIKKITFSIGKVVSVMAVYFFFLCQSQVLMISLFGVTLVSGIIGRGRHLAEWAEGSVVTTTVEWAAKKRGIFQCSADIDPSMTRVWPVVVIYKAGPKVSIKRRVPPLLPSIKENA